MHYTLDPDTDVTGDSIGSVGVQLSLLEFVDREIVESLTRSNKRRLVVPVSVTGHPNIQIESAPFALVNPALFISYLSRGTVGYVATARGVGGVQNPVAILSDITYLEGMEGGVAFLDDGVTESINKRQVLGIVLGSLRKNSGEGKMTVIAPWDLIASSLIGKISGIEDLVSSNYSLQESPVSCLITPPTTPPINATTLSSVTPSKAAMTSTGPAINLSPTSSFRGVVAVVVTTGKLRMWGSGVLIDPSTIVTNLHVIGVNPNRITAWFSNTEQVNLSVIGTPIDGIDMVFLKLEQPTSRQPLIISKQKPLGGDCVESIGYGIFYPHGMGSSFGPLRSRGIISKVLHMPLNDDYPANQSDNVPAMIISSAGCWNGSSGGAVLDSKSGYLIGLMASNGRSHRTGEIISDMAFVIPSNIVNYGWSLLKSSRTVHASSRVRQLWKLQPTHKSIYKMKSKM